jgi:hypothetical protein
MASAGGRHSFAVQSRQDRLDRSYAMGVQNPFFEAPVTQDFPRELDEIQCPQPFDIGFRLDVVNHHLADGLKVVTALAGKQEGRLRERYQFSWYRKGPAALSGCFILEIQHGRPRLF